MKRIGNIRISVLLCLLASLCAGTVRGESLELRAEAALNDGLYPVAERYAQRLLKKAETPADRLNAAVLLARAQYGEMRYAEIHELYAEYAEQAGADALLYWEARALAAESKFDDALQQIAPLAGATNAPARMLALKAELQGGAGRTNEALKTADVFMTRYPQDALAPSVLFLKAEYAAGNTELYRKTLDRLIAGYPESEQQRAARFLLAESLTQEPETDVGRIGKLMLPVAENAEEALLRRTEAYRLLARAHEKSGAFADAADMLGKAAELTEENKRIPVRIAQARMLHRAGKKEEAYALLDSLAGSDSGISDAAAVRFALSELQFEDKRYQEAAASCQAVLSVSEDPAVQGPAYHRLGWSNWFSGRWEEAGAAFRSSAALQRDPALKAEARLKAGDSFWRAGKFGQAAEDYVLVAEESAGSGLIPQARFQEGLCRLRLEETETALKLFESVRLKFAGSVFAERAALEIARMQEQNGEWKSALNTYADLLKDAKDREARLFAMLRQGFIFYRLTNFQESLDTFGQVLKEFDGEPEAERAFYMRGFCLLMMGEPEKALQICREFVEKHPASPWNPEVSFWLGEYYHNHAGYSSAEEVFAGLADSFPEHELAPDALYRAGRAAAAQENFLKSVEYFSRLARDYPDSTLLPDARFGQGEALSELGEFASAILAFDEIINKFPDSWLANAARGRKGDCLFTLAAGEPDRYKEARALYQQVLQDAGATPEQLLQAEYKIGRCDEQTGNDTQALMRYMNVVYSCLETGAPLNREQSLWFTRAVFGAGALQEKASAWREAIGIYQRAVDAGVPAAEEARKRIARIKREQMILF